MQQLLRGFQQGAHQRGDVDPMPLLRRPIVSVLGRDETERAKAAKAGHATHIGRRRRTRLSLRRIRRHASLAKRNRRPGQKPLTTTAPPRLPRPAQPLARRRFRQPPKTNEAELATHPTACLPARPATPRRLVGIEREARPRDNATVLYPPAKAALVFQKNQPSFSM